VGSSPGRIVPLAEGPGRLEQLEKGNNAPVLFVPAHIDPASELSGALPPPQLDPHSRMESHGPAAS